MFGTNELVQVNSSFGGSDLMCFSQFSCLSIRYSFSDNSSVGEIVFSPSVVLKPGNNSYEFPGSKDWSKSL